MKRELGLDEIINLGLNENPLGPSPKTVRAVNEAAKQMHLYPDPGALELRSVIALAHGVEPDQVLQGNGASELISLFSEAFIDNGDEMLTPEPTFHQFQDATHIMGGKNILSPLKNFRIDLDDMARKITPKTKLIILINPNNPTGDMLTKPEVEEFLARVGKEKIVIFDEAYAPYVEREKDFPDTVEFIRQGYNIVVLRSFSKAYGLAGMRVGYAISRPEFIRRMVRIRNVFNVSRLAQKAAVEAFKDKEHLQKSVKLVWEEKKYYYREFENMGLFFYPTSSNFILVNVGVDDVKLAESMKRRGVIISPQTSNGYKGFIRVTIGTHEQNVKMIACLKGCLAEL
ncbi:MAG: histidinol-phosphate transaminase [Deltaproteobacteria bacterium]|nr:histidinol-phosphate transaminase [Deltaproteobacteria bacterium]